VTLQSRKLRSVKFNTTRLCRLLTRSAVEHLTAFRKSESRDFSSVRNVVTSDFEAMYAYKLQIYEECFHICERHVDRLLYVDLSTVVGVFRVKESDLITSGGR
jgi:regulator of replication initiation timing